MFFRQKDNIPYLQFPNLAAHEDICHGVFTRKGGHSEGNYTSLNISSGVGDSEENVAQNQQEVSQCMEDFPLILINQVHGSEIIRFREIEDIRSYFSDREELRPLPKADAMITGVPGACLTIQVADCQALLLYDPVRRVIGGVHCGWRGSVESIPSKTVRVMESEFGCHPRDILVGISPSLGPCCAEFVNYKKEIPEEYWRYKDDSNYFDLWTITRDQLCSTGVSPANIYSSELCTECHPEKFFSYRGEEETGRFAVVIGLIHR